MSDAVTPIFILGLQRSGTTWMANSLGGHPRIVAVEAEDHQGVHESIFFSHFARAFGDLADDANFARFSEDFMACDYFLLAEVPREDFLAARPRTYPAAFAFVMERLARRRGADFWLEKSPHHTLLGRELARDFPAARFVCMTRRPQELLRSRIVGYGRERPGPVQRKMQVFKGCLAVALYEKFILRFCADEPRALHVRYEDMLADPHAVLQQVAGFLGCGFHPVLLERRYRPNTSFASDREKETVLGPLDRTLAAAVMPALRLLPLAWLRRWSTWKSDRQGLQWPDWCWRRKPGHVPHVR